MQPTARLMSQIAYDSLGISLHYRSPPTALFSAGVGTPHLRLGTVDDLAVSVGYRHVDSSRHFHGLEEYIRSDLMGVPTYFFDNHNHALFGWFEAFNEGRIGMGSTLIHFDSHADSIITAYTIYRPTDMQEVFDITQRCKIYDFIHPAYQAGLIDKVIWVHPDMKGKPATITTNPFGGAEITTVGIDDPMLERILSGPRDKIIVDIDLDYFMDTFSDDRVRHQIRKAERMSDIILGSSDWHYHIGMMRQAAIRAGVVTVATSPGYIDQENAIYTAKQIFRHG